MQSIKGTPNRMCTVDLSMPIHEIDRRWQIITGQVKYSTVGTVEETYKTDEHMFFRKRVQRFFTVLYIDLNSLDLGPIFIKGKKDELRNGILWR